jgi:hypothetical protein
MVKRGKQRDNAATLEAVTAMHDVRDCEIIRKAKMGDDVRFN